MIKLHLMLQMYAFIFKTTSADRVIFIKTSPNNAPPSHFPGTKNLSPVDSIISFFQESGYSTCRGVAGYP